MNNTKEIMKTMFDVLLNNDEIKEMVRELYKNFNGIDKQWKEFKFHMFEKLFYETVSKDQNLMSIVANDIYDSINN